MLEFSGEESKVLGFSAWLKFVNVDVVGPDKVVIVLFSIELLVSQIGQSGLYYWDRLQQLVGGLLHFDSQEKMS